MAVEEKVLIPLMFMVTLISLVVDGYTFMG